MAAAGGAGWVYWMLSGRFQPVAVKRHESEIQRLLEDSAWIPAGAGEVPVWIVGYRDSAALQRYLAEEGPRLRAAGLQPRIVMFARSDRGGTPLSTAAERATAAELWRTRDPELLGRWMAAAPRNWTAAGIADADDDPRRTRLVESGRELVAALTRRLRASGLQASYPLILWRGPDGGLKACACADARSWPLVRDELGAPERVAAEPTSVGRPASAPLPYPRTQAGGLPYPSLPPIPPEAPERAAAAAEPPAAAPPRPPRRAAPRPPQPRRSDDTLFY